MSHTQIFPRRLMAAMAAVMLVMVAALSGCSADKEHEKPHALATFTVLADIAQNVGGDYIQVDSLTKPGTEIHGYDPTPSDLKAASDADLIMSNGMGLEHWIDKLTSQSDAKRLVVTEGITPISIAEGAAEGEDNPHAWMSPNLVKTYVDNIAGAFAELDPDHKDEFQKNADSYKKELDKIQTNMVKGLEGLPDNQRALVTCEGAFSYLAKDGGLQEKYIWPVNAETEATPQSMKAVEDYVKENKVPAVFCESTVDGGPQEQIARATGARDGGILYVDSLSEEGGPVPTYLKLIQYDVDTIVKGLTNK